MFTSQKAEESERERRAAANAIDQNLCIPAFYFKGRAERRRFRVGQRVQCGMAAINEWATGTVVTLYYRISEDAHFPYEVELDSGMHCSAPEDTDRAIRRLAGAPIVLGAHPIAQDVAAIADAEMREFSLCDKFADATLPRLDRHVCQGCGLRSDSKLMVCGRCGVGVYCSGDCQRRMHASHKAACKEMVACKELLVIQGVRRMPPGVKTEIEDRGMDETLKQHLTSLGEPPGGAGLLARLIFRARAAGHQENLQALAQLLAGFGGALDTPIESPSGFTIGMMEDMMGRIFVTTESLARLVHGVVTFAQTDPRLANLFAACVKLFRKISYFRPLVPYLESTNKPARDLDESDFGKFVRLNQQAKDGDADANFELGMQLWKEALAAEVPTRRKEAQKNARKFWKRAVAGGHTEAKRMLRKSKVLVGAPERAPESTSSQQAAVDDVD